jgi:hypothetical protein
MACSGCGQAEYEILCSTVPDWPKAESPSNSGSGVPRSSQKIAGEECARIMSRTQIGYLLRNLHAVAPPPLKKKPTAPQSTVLPSASAYSGMWHLVGLVATTLVALPDLGYPIYRDQATFLVLGDGLLHGQLPYRERPSHHQRRRGQQHHRQVLAYRSGRLSAGEV